jgi:peptidyl-prolyl cis-trans isomerase C
VNGVTIPATRFDAMNRELSEQGQPDNPERQMAVKEELINREILSQAAAKRGLDKSADVAAQMDMARQAVLVRALFESEIKANPITDDMLKAQYEQFKTSMGTNEYKVRHILVEKEDEAKAIVAELNRGGDFQQDCEGEVEGPGLEGQRRRPRLGSLRPLREAVRDAVQATPKGSNDHDAGEDRLRLSRDPRGRRASAEGADV